VPPLSPLPQLLKTPRQKLPPLPPPWHPAAVKQRPPQQQRPRQQCL